MKRYLCGLDIACGGVCGLDNARLYALLRAPAINNVGKIRENYVRALDEAGKKWYDSTMENNIEINKIIAKNLMTYRKKAGLTQAELAEKINYSDKSVSKWESGNGVPDVYTLMLLAKLYGVTLNDFVGEQAPTEKEKRMRGTMRGFHGWIMLLSSGIVWLVATCFFVMMQLWLPGREWWVAFLYAVWANAIVLIVFSAIWKYRVVNFISVTALIWMVLTSAHLTIKFVAGRCGIEFEALWMLYLLGIPLQALECMWTYFRARARRLKAVRRLTQKKDEKLENEKESAEGGSAKAE